MSKADKDHFETYRVQTQVKHRLLTDYLPAYLNVLGTTNKNILYIDGFAGRGFYVDDEGTEHAGSPLRALEVVSSEAKYKDKVFCFFVENRRDHFTDLEKRVAAFLKKTPLAKEPHLSNDPFSSFMKEEIHDFLKKPSNRLAPTFLFVDPCGVEDVLMKDVAAVLSLHGCEAFIFFNYEGVNRIAGLAESVGSSKTLDELFGSRQRSQSLIAALKKAGTSKKREQVIMSHFRLALIEESGAKYILPFRIESENKRSTSHYLLHATKHELGFKIMKEVMERVARDKGAEAGTFQLLQASPTETGLFVDANVQAAKDAIIQHLKAEKKCKVERFRKEWVVRPDDLFTSSSYRRILLDMEEEDLIEVLDKAGKNPEPPSKRKAFKGEPSMPEGNWLRLRSR